MVTRPLGMDKYLSTDTAQKRYDEPIPVQIANREVRIETLLELLGIYVPEGAASWKSNCFSGETEILTRKGPERFDRGEREVETWDGFSNSWVTAKVRKYGRDVVQKVNFVPMHRNHRGGWQKSGASTISCSVVVTKNHRWPLDLPYTKTTTDLRVGDIVPAWRPPTGKTPEGMVAGFTYGDGSTRNSGQAKSSLYHVPLNGEKDQALTPWIEALPKIGKGKKIPEDDMGIYFAGWTTVTVGEWMGNPSYEVPCARIRTWRRLKELPDDPDPGFLEGWCLADAHSPREGVWRLFSKLEDGQWLRSYAASQGMVYGSYTQKSGKTNMAERRPSAEFSLTTNERAWKVESIEEMEGEVDVWCAETATSWLTLASGVASGNCPFGEEHEDGGRDKNFRVYGVTNTCMCFALHGFLTPAKLWSIHTGKKEIQAAEDLITKFDIQGYKETYREKMGRLTQDNNPTLNRGDLWAAMDLKLKSYPEYIKHQYDKDVLTVVQLIQGRSKELSNDISSEELETWYNQQTRVIEQLMTYLRLKDG